jgi:hypothetical protein
VPIVSMLTPETVEGRDKFYSVVAGEQPLEDSASA